MEELGVISKAEQPSEWCATMVVVLKKSGAIRICVDYRPLNEVVLWEVHRLPKVDESLAQLSGAVVFSKIRMPIEVFGKFHCRKTASISLPS